MSHVAKVLDTLCKHYARPDGTPHALNDTQGALYISLLEKYPHEALTGAAVQWIQTSRFFPAISDLVGILDPVRDPKTLAALAWSEVEKLTRRVSGYDSVLFEDPVLGEAVKRTFGTWTRATTMDQNDPMWASRRNVFLSIYPALLAQPPSEPVRVNGIGGIGRELVAVETTRELPLLTNGGPDKSPSVLAEVKRRFALVSNARA